MLGAGHGGCRPGKGTRRRWHLSRNNPEVGEREAGPDRRNVSQAEAQPGGWWGWSRAAQREIGREEGRGQITADFKSLEAFHFSCEGLGGPCRAGGAGVAGPHGHTTGHSGSHVETILKGAGPGAERPARRLSDSSGASSLMQVAAGRLSSGRIRGRILKVKSAGGFDRGSRLELGSQAV